VLFGTTGTAQALDPRGTTPIGVGAARLLVGGTVLLCALPLLGGRPARASAVPAVLLRRGAAHAGVALGTLVTIGSGPVFAGMLALGARKETPTRSWLAATGLCVLGLGLLTARTAPGRAG